MGDLPNDPVSDLAASAAQLHELYLAWIDAGFSEQQAMYLVGLIVTGAKPQP